MPQGTDELIPSPSLLPVPLLAVCAAGVAGLTPLCPSGGGGGRDELTHTWVSGALATVIYSNLRTMSGDMF